jgi:hypothetical protein
MSSLLRARAPNSESFRERGAFARRGGQAERAAELARPRKTSHVASTGREGRTRRARIGSAGLSRSSDRAREGGEVAYARTDVTRKC